MKSDPLNSVRSASTRVFWRLSLSLLCASALESSLEAQMRFFRVVGPAPATILGLSTDGSVTWSVEQPNLTYVVQTTQSLIEPVDWSDYTRIAVASSGIRQRLFDADPPSGMVFIPAGTFTMGDSFSEGESNELPGHSVFTSAFYLDKFEVTMDLWTEVYDWATHHGYSFDNPGTGKAGSHPVYYVSWYDAVKWCNARSEMEGRKPAYYTSSTQTIPYRTGRLELYNRFVKWDAGYRLPTEAEWERAARGGASGLRFPWGDTISLEQANYGAQLGNGGVTSYDLSFGQGYHPTYNDGVQPYTSPVGSFEADRYGLFDMRGNLWEWCWDRFGSYTSVSVNDPRGTDSNFSRARRGGSWRNAAYRLRSSDRQGDDAALADIVIGFRTALPSIQP